MQVLRTFSRVYADDLDTTLEMFRAVGLPATGTCRFSLPHKDVEVCVTGDTVIIAGDEAALRPLRATDTTWVVDDLDAAMAILAPSANSIVRPPAAVPTGRNATIRTGGIQVELVEWANSPTSVP